jgi:hypothetical protein
MPEVTNKTNKPLSVPLPGGKKLHLGPGKTGQVAANAVDAAAVKKLVEAGAIDISQDDAQRTGTAALGRGGRKVGEGHSAGGAMRRSGDR